MLARTAVFVSIAAAVLACGALLGLDEDDAPPPPPAVEAATDVIDSAAEGASGETARYNDIADRTRWESLPLAAISDDFVPRGGAFDGRYLYLTPHRTTTGGIYGGRIWRFDSARPLAEAAAWSSFDVTQTENDAGNMRGVAFDGRYLFFMAIAGKWSRIDTTGAFDVSSLTVTDPTKWSNDAYGFAGAVFDGRWVYGVPGLSANPDGGIAISSNLFARYDTTRDLASQTSWEFYTSPTRATRHGGAFDGRYVYFVDRFLGSLARYDTTKPFAADGSWESTVIPAPSDSGWNGAVFDGRYIHLVPAFIGDGADAGTPNALTSMIRYDTQRPFDASSFDTFDVAPLIGGAFGFAGGTFDGRYVWFAPHARTSQGANTTIGPLTTHGHVVRYDTTAPHGAMSSWSTFDTTTLPNAPAGFVGAIFDGQHVYFIPRRQPVLARFDARTPSALPPGSHASFW